MKDLNHAYSELVLAMAKASHAIVEMGRLLPGNPPDDLPEGVKREHNGISFVDGTTGVPWLARLNGGEVEFWDRRHPHDPDLQAQFVSSYYASTVRRSTGGFNLSGGTPSWSLDSRSMDIVRTYLLKD